MNVKQKHKHSLDELNSQLNHGMEVYAHYYYLATGKNLQAPGRRMVSPFLRGGKLEKDPSFSIYYHETKGTVFFKDQGNGRTGSHWQFVMDLFGCDFQDALEKVKSEILGFREDGSRSIKTKMVNYPVPVAEPRAPVLIYPSMMDWEESDLEWFATAGISARTLKDFEAYRAPHYDISKDNKTYRITEKPGDPIYVFDSFAGGRKKIYRPFSADRRFKWTSNLIAEEDVFGYKRVPKSGDYIFLLAGNRDTMSFTENVGIPALALASESSNVPGWLLDILKHGYKKIFTLYDNDKQGLRKSEEFESEHGFIPMTYVYNKFKGDNENRTANDFVNMYQNNDVNDFSIFLHNEIKKLYTV